MTKRFEGRTVIVTGAASGIGWETATRFLAEGATVVAGDRSLEVPDGVLGVHTDVSSPADVEHCSFRSPWKRRGVFDVMCNIAGIGSTTDALDCTPEECDRVFAVNAKGVFLGTKFALPPMLEHRRGVIVNMASVAALVGLRDRAAYCASKGAVVAFTKQVAVQYAAHGVRVRTSICPGTVETPWVARLLADGIQPGEFGCNDLIARQPLGRLGEPAEIAMAVLYAASDDAAFMTGTELEIDGGITAGVGLSRRTCSSADQQGRGRQRSRPPAHGSAASCTAGSRCRAEVM